MDAELLVDRLQDEAALSSTYGKGLKLARDLAVARFETISGGLGETVLLKGRVEGSHRELYRTEVSLDLGSDEILDYACTCMAAANYPGMCKHEVALVLEYLGRLDEGPLIPARKEKALERACGGQVASVPSSAQVVRLMEDIAGRQLHEDERAREQRGRVAQGVDALDFQVTISPSVESRYGAERTWCIRLRICRGRNGYIVRDIGALIEAYQGKRSLAFGKSIPFVCGASAFSPCARALLDILEPVVRSQRALFASSRVCRSIGLSENTKELALAACDVISVLEALRGHDVLFEPDSSSYGSRGSLRTLAVEAGNPRVSVRVEASSRGAYNLRVGEGEYCLFDGRRMCILDESHAWLCSPAYAERSGELFSEMLPSHGPLRVAEEDVMGFVRTLLPALRAATDVEIPPSLARLRPPEPTFTFRIGLDGDVVTCGVTVAYGHREESLFSPDAAGVHGSQSVVSTYDRDAVAERRVIEAVEEFFPDEVYGAPSFDEADDELLYRLLTEGVKVFSDLGMVLLSERLKSRTVQDGPSLSVSVTVDHGLLDFEVGASGLSAHDLEAYLAAYHRKQRFVRLSSGDILRLRGDADAINGFAEGIGATPEELAVGVRGVPLYRAPFADSLLDDAPGISFVRDEAYRKIMREFEPYENLDVPVPVSLAPILRPYQQDGFRWLQMLDRLGLGGILADDMGLGKTLQVICYILACKEMAASGSSVSLAVPEDAATSAPALVVCPASLVYNWMAELERFACVLDAVAVLGSKAKRRAIIADATSHDVLVTSYDLMKRDIDEYREIEFSRVVLDEAQYIKNPSARVSRAAKRLRSRTRIACTGTPIENRLQELWNIFDFLMPGVLGTCEWFTKHYGNSVEGGDSTAAMRLRSMVAPFILRRMKGDVLADLPEKTESVVFASMSGEQEKLYRANQDRIAMQITHQLPDEFKKKKLKVLAELTKLRQICCDPALAYEGYSGGSAKLETCLELVRSAVAGGHKVLLFSQFTSMLDIMVKRLLAERIGHFMLTGSTSKEERARLVEAFQAGEVPVFLISLKAGGVGLNLTEADVVIHYDPWWNVTAQDQATDRAHRIGQRRAVSVYKLACKDTIEEKILEMQESKRHLAEQIIGGEGMGAATLTKDEILALLSAGCV